MTQITTVGIDLAKRVNALHGIDRTGSVLFEEDGTSGAAARDCGGFASMSDWYGGRQWRA